MGFSFFLRVSTYSLQSFRLNFIERELSRYGQNCVTYLELTNKRARSRRSSTQNGGWITLNYACIHHSFMGGYIKMKRIIFGAVIAMAMGTGSNAIYAAPIHDAAYRYDVKAVQHELDAGIDVNTKNEIGWTALIVAAYYQCTDVVSQLLRHPDIDVNAKNENGWTALMYASLWGYTNVVTQLLAHSKIDVNVKNEDGYNALDIANVMYCSCIPRLIKEHTKNAAATLRGYRIKSAVNR